MIGRALTFPILWQVYGFTLDQQIGEFVLSHPDIKIPESGKIYSFNEGNYANWNQGLQKYMDSLKVGAHSRQRRRTPEHSTGAWCSLAAGRTRPVAVLVRPSG